MAKLEIIRMGHPTLKKTAALMTKEEILSSETVNLVNDMQETMKDLQGIGLAAPQVNVSKQLAIIHVPESSSRYKDLENLKGAHQKFVIFNPIVTIIDTSLQGMWEGCLSIPGLRGYVERPRKIKVTYLDQDAKFCQLVLDGLLAIVFQHELDHLFGTLYLERVTDLKLLSFSEEYDQFILPQNSVKQS